MLGGDEKEDGLERRTGNQQWNGLMPFYRPFPLAIIPIFPPQQVLSRNIFFSSIFILFSVSDLFILQWDGFEEGEETREGRAKRSLLLCAWLRPEASPLSLSISPPFRFVSSFDHTILGTMLEIW